LLEINETIAAIKELDREAMENCRARLDSLVKPMGSLGALEDLAVKMAGISQNPRPGHLLKTLIVFAADHGINLEKPDTNPFFGRETALKAANGASFIKSFAEHSGVRLVLADIGLAGNLPETSGILNMKIASGTKNIAAGAAMTREEAIEAVKAGIRLSESEIFRGAGLIGLGSIGIGSNISSAAIIAACCQIPGASLINERSFIAKEIAAGEANIIDKILAINNPDKSDAVDVLAKLGGFEIAALVGVILGAAKKRAAVVIDGTATSAAALIAVKLAPLSREFLIGSVKTNEPCRQKALDALNLCAYLDLDMSAQEGYGAVLGMSLVKAAIFVLNDMKTFDETGVPVAQKNVQYKQK
jgi:nicotinate-nucleotide--dimethylbenzimidazole phosphoribosyltransferase